jgi:hypothetical protein
MNNAGQAGRLSSPGHGPFSHPAHAFAPRRNEPRSGGVTPLAVKSIDCDCLRLTESGRFVILSHTAEASATDSPLYPGTVERKTSGLLFWIIETDPEPWRAFPGILHE